VLSRGGVPLVLRVSGGLDAADLRSLGKGGVMSLESDVGNVLMVADGSI